MPKAKPSSEAPLGAPAAVFLGRPEGGSLCAVDGVLEAEAAAPDRVSFYAPDFFLQTRTPWLIPEGPVVDSITAERAPAPAIAWREPDRASYATIFADLQERIANGELKKATPVVFATGTHDGSMADVAGSLMGQAFAAARPAIPFGCWSAGATDGIVGATPEVLFSLTADGTIETMALAGTAAPEHADGLLADAKERKEHQFVIDAIVDALAPFGTVRVAETEVLRLPHLAHLRTGIRVETAERPDFASLVGALHPTPALGGTPSARAFEWLRQCDHGVDRGRFGAPFGVRFPDGSGWCVVAIRAVSWIGSTLRVGSGAGIIAESRLDREWDELARKREAVRRMLWS